MDIARDLAALDAGHWAGAAATLGVFDGVHRGHQAVLARTRSRAREFGGPAVVITFDRHPRETLTGSAPPQLVPLDYRLRCIGALGIDACLVLPFDREMAAREARWFAEEVLVRKIGARAAVLGYDCRFGHRGVGDAAFLSAQTDLGLFVESVGPLPCSNNIPISSTVVREAIESGELDHAAELLGRPVQIAGPVIHGDGRGRTLGFPTANVDHSGFLLPPNGVYAGRVEWDEGQRPAVVNIGTRPTFDDSGRIWLEALLLDFEGDLYGRSLTVSLMARLREERPFESVEALRVQIQADRDRAQTLLGSA